MLPKSVVDSAESVILELDVLVKFECASEIRFEFRNLKRLANYDIYIM